MNPWIALLIGLVLGGFLTAWILALSVVVRGYKAERDRQRGAAS